MSIDSGGLRPEPSGRGVRRWGAAMRLTCSGCQRELAPHCRAPEDARESRCDWWRCSNRGCDHDIYDVVLGTLLHTDGVLEDLTSDG